MKRLSTIELHKENLKFSAGHFTIFSETEREHLHGHNYQVFAAITTVIEENGLNFDYRFYKSMIREYCKQLNQTFLLPTKSRYLTIHEEGDYCYAHFNQEKIPFLKKDITYLPLTNITVEELSSWFLDKLTEDKAQLNQHQIQEIVIKVYNGSSQSGSANWKRPEST